MTDEYEFMCKREPICPHCRHAIGEAWDIGDGGEGEWEVECGDCEKPVMVQRHISVSYSTRAAGGAA